jgi:transportin-1
MLHEALTSSDNTRQREIASQLDLYLQSPEFSCYLLLVLQDQSTAQQVRLTAGHTLKAAVEKVEVYTPETLQYLRTGVEAALYDAVANVAAALYSRHRPWSSLLQHIDALLVENPAVLEVLFGVLEDIQGNSDCAAVFDSAEFTQVLRPLIKKLVDFVPLHPTSMKCINQLLFIMPSALVSQVPAYCAAVLGQLGTYSREVAESVVVISTMRKDIVLKHFALFADYMLTCLGTPQANSACDFWGEWLLQPDCLKPYLGRLLAGVVDCLKLTDADLMDIMPETDADFRHDREEDPSCNWTIRREAAVLLDRISQALGGVCFIEVQSKIEALLSSSDWRTLEYGLLAFGALARGCRQSIAPFLPQMLPFLLTKMRAEHRLVRSMAIWAVSRFTEDFLAGEALRLYLQNLMQSVMEPDSLVQSAACTAFCILIVRCSPEVTHYLPELLQILATATSVYRGRAMLNLLDAVSSLCDALGETLRDPQYLSLIVAPLLSLWERTADDDRLLWTLMETFTSLLLAIGLGAKPWLISHLDRTHRVLKMALQDQFDKQFGVKALELVSTIIEVSEAELIEPVGAVVMTLLQSLYDADSSVKQYACAAVGSLAGFLPVLAAPVFDQLVEGLASCLKTVPQHQLDSETVFSGCNNAACALAELAVKYPEAMRPHVHSVLPKMLGAANEPCKISFYQAYMYCALGKFSCAEPSRLAAELPHTILKWSANISRQSCL